MGKLKKCWWLIISIIKKGDKAIVEKINNSNFELAKKIHATNGLSGSSNEAYSFIMTALNLIENKDFAEAELLEIITDGDDDCGIDAVYISENYIDIFAVSAKKLDYPEINLLYKSVQNTVINNLEKDDKKYFDSLNKKIQDFLKKIYRSRKKRTVRVFAIYKDVASKSILSEFKKNRNYKFTFYSIRNLINLKLEREKYLDEYKFKVKKNNIIEEKKNVLIFKARIVDLLKLQKQSLEQGSDLFNKNVRIFLNNNGLKEEFRNTINSEPEKFYLFHNGITITTPEKIGKQQGGKISIYKPQVVNGAQTINSLFEEFKINLNDENLKKAYVIVKIIKADKKLTTKVCETANTQLPIKMWDLRANDDIQKRLELFFDAIGYKYLRKSRQKAGKSNKGIQLAKFIQWFYSIYFNNPADAKDKKKYLFEASSKNGLYKKIEDKIKDVFNSKPENLIKIIKIALFVDDKIKEEKDKERKGLMRDADMHIVTTLFKKDISKFNEVVSFLEEHVSELKRKDPKLTNNKIFTKSQNTINSLLQNIKNRKQDA